MSVPTVPGSEIGVSTPGKGGRLDEGALNAPARATLAAVDARARGGREVAGAIEDVGGALGRLSSDLEKVHRARIAADSDFRMRAAQQTFMESIKGDQNEGDWSARARQVYEGVREDVYASGAIPPGMRPELDASLQSWGQTLQIKAQTLAAAQSVNRAEVAIRKSYEEAGRDGDAAGMVNAVKLGRSSKLDPVAMDELAANIPRSLALTAIENGLRTNPQGTHELLVSGGSLPIDGPDGKPIVPGKVFPQKELAALVNSSRTQAAAWQKGNFENLLQSEADPITGLVPEGTVNAKIASGEISAAAGRNLLAAQDRKIKADKASYDREVARDDRDAYNVLEGRIHDPTAWGDEPDRYAADMVAEAASINNPALRQRAINDANRNLDSLKKKASLSEKPVEAQVMALMREDKQESGAMLPVRVADVAATPAKRHFFRRDEPATLATTKYLSIPGGLGAVRKMSDAEILDNYGTGAKDEDPAKVRDSVVAEINVHHARLENEMREWFKTPEGEKATFEQANAHRMEVERPYVLESVWNSLAKRAPSLVSSKAEFDALPSGAPFLFNGRLGTKK